MISLYTDGEVLMFGIFWSLRGLPNAKIIKLEENYRSTQVILDAANEVIKNNSDRKDKRLWTQKGQGGKIIVHKVPDEREEAEIICQHIHKHIVSDNKNPRDFAIATEQMPNLESLKMFL